MWLSGVIGNCQKCRTLLLFVLLYCLWWLDILILRITTLTHDRWFWVTGWNVYFQLSTLPESVIVETTEYKCLQSQFSVLYNESMQMKTQLDESRSLLTNSKNAHLRQIEQMEVGCYFSLLVQCGRVYTLLVHTRLDLIQDKIISSTAVNLNFTYWLACQSILVNIPVHIG